MHIGLTNESCYNEETVCLLNEQTCLLNEQTCLLNEETCLLNEETFYWMNRLFTEWRLVCWMNRLVYWMKRLAYRIKRLVYWMKLTCTVNTACRANRHAVATFFRIKRYWDLYSHTCISHDYIKRIKRLVNTHISYIYRCLLIQCVNVCVLYIFNMEKNIFMQWCIIFNWFVVYIQSNKYLHRFSYKLNSILKASSFNFTVAMSLFSISKCSHSLK